MNLDFCDVDIWCLRLLLNCLTISNSHLIELSLCEIFRRHNFISRYEGVENRDPRVLGTKVPPQGTRYEQVPRSSPSLLLGIAYTDCTRGMSPTSEPRRTQRTNRFFEIVLSFASSMTRITQTKVGEYLVPGSDGLQVMELVAIKCVDRTKIQQNPVPI